MRIIKSNHWHFAKWKHWLIVWCSCSSNSTSMNLWFWLQKRICIISAFNFRTKKTLPHERSEKRILFLSLIVNICQHRENPQIAERNPFNVRERECYTHQENHQKMSTNSFSPSLCLCMYVIESHGICLCVAWMMTLIPNVSVLMHVEMKLGPKLTKNSFACTFPANSFHAIPHLLITTEIINVEICSDATEISYVCVRASCRHSTSVFVSVVKYLRNLFLQSADQMATESTHFQAPLCHDDVDFRENDQHSHQNRVTTWPQLSKCVRKQALQRNAYQLVVIMCQYYFCCCGCSVLCHRISFRLTFGINPIEMCTRMRFA